MPLIDLVKTPRKKALLCLIYYGKIGSSFWNSSDLGYHTLPRSFAVTMSRDVFRELIEQLTLDRLIQQSQRHSERGPLLIWRTTASGKRIVKKLLEEPLPKLVATVGNVNEGEFLINKFDLRRYEASESAL